MKKKTMLFLQENLQTRRLLEDTGEISVVLFPEIKGNFDLVDAVFFDGGADINPALYKPPEPDIECGPPNHKRDTFELTVFLRTAATHYHFGICRGSQLMWVANGGSLWQDITGHAIHGTHGLFTDNHKITPEVHLADGVTSTHHQAARVTNQFGLDRAFAYESFPDPVQAIAYGIKTDIQRVVEGHWHPATRTLGIQGHPEYSHASPEYQSWVIDQLLVNDTTRIK